MLGRRHEALPFKRRLDQENQLDQETSFPLDSLLDSDVVFDSKFPLDLEDLPTWTMWRTCSSSEYRTCAGTRISPGSSLALSGCNSSG